MASASEKTEQPTQKRLADLRKKGQVAHSAELATAVGLLGGLWLMQASMSRLYGEMSQIMMQVLGHSGTLALTPSMLQLGILRVLQICLVAMGPLLLGLVIMGVITTFGQTRFLLSMKAITPTFDKINPAGGLKRLFSMAKLIDGLKLTFRLGVVALFLWMLLTVSLRDILNLPMQSYFQSWQNAASLTGNTLWQIAVVFALVGVIDYALTRRRYQRDARMTRQEVRDEFKQNEGNPQVKAKIRQKMRARLRAASRRRLTTVIPNADVVVTNPTHFAVALRYNPKEGRAPRVVAKGQDYMAARIRQLARQHGIPLVENRPLAQALYKSVPVDAEIPAHLYQAVAQVLAYIYRLRNRPTAARPAAARAIR